MKTAVIVTTYNRPDALALALEGYLSQKDKDFELIVADDGSTAETKKTIASYSNRHVINIRHVWHEDQGFRAAQIRNRAIAATFSDYVIFSDGDCIPLPDFVSSHKYLAEKNWFVAGSRVLLSKSFTHAVLKKSIQLCHWRSSQWITARIKKDINRLTPLLSLPISNRLRKITPNSWSSVMTCNMSAWRKDLIRVNGFDEDYVGWGLEDSDLVIRLLHAKILRKSARFSSPVLHLWHKENDRECLPDNRRRLDELMQSNRFQATKGVDQYI
ncbi:MAG TPA: glycosyltransferase family 2 protein [Smithellaceae bacterium]|jgi:glycosyltransferase involved in cell wall biosynthesis|nr:glycosyltransferase family 2 protein [Smithellaceae bacterium]